VNPRFITAWAVFLLAALDGQAAVVDPDVKQYGVGKSKAYVQTGPGTVTFANFTFEAFVELKPGGTLQSATLLGPLVGGTQILTIHTDDAAFESAAFTGDPTIAKSNLNASYPNSTPGNAATNYSLTFVTGANATYSASFSLTGDAYAATIPLFTLDNGSWNNGAYLLDPAQATNFGWALPDYNAATDIVRFEIQPKTGGSELVEQQFQGSNPGGYTVGAGLLTPGVEYVGELIFARLVDINTSTVPGVQGFAFYAIETNFNFVAIPEPPACALLVLGLGLVARTLRRRRA
jgi:hypothetical protein